MLNLGLKEGSGASVTAKVRTIFYFTIKNIAAQFRFTRLPEDF